MHLPREKYNPILSERMQDILTFFQRAGRRLFSWCNVSKIVLMASQGVTNKGISEKIEKNYNTVALWRKRFIEAGFVLAFVEAELPKQLKELDIAILSDEHKSGAPKTYDDDIKCRIKLIVCQKPEDNVFIISHWNFLRLCLALIDTGIVEDIFVGALYNLLKTAKIHP